MTPVEFLESEVLPALFGVLDLAFPEFGWQRRRRGWVATERVQGVDARPDRVVCNLPRGFLVHGKDSTAWVAYVSGKTDPRGADWFAAVRELAERAGVDPSPLDRPLSPEEERRGERARAREALFEDFVETSRRALCEPDHGDALAYVVRRGFEPPDLEGAEFGLASTAVLEALRGRHGDVVDRADLPRLSSRLVHPWRDERGRIGTFWGRDLSGASERKYLYLARRDGWVEGTSDLPPFGYGTARRMLQGSFSERSRNPGLVLVEGHFDALLLQAKGVPAAALGGTSGSGAKLFRRLQEDGLSEATFVFDYDPKGDGAFPGLDAARRVTYEYKGTHGSNVYIVDPRDMGDGGSKVDPASLVQEKGADAFKALLERRVPAVVFACSERFLDGVSPTSDEGVKRRGVENVARYSEGLRGPWAPRDTALLLRLLEERTGWERSEFEKVVEAARERGRQEEREKRFDKILSEVRDRRARGDGVEALLPALDQATSELRLDAFGAPPPFSVSSLVDALSRVAKGRSTGWNALDQIGIRLAPEELVVVGGRTGHAKTTFAVNLFRNLVEASLDRPEDEGGVFLFYTFEEPATRVFARLLALEAARRGDRWASDFRGAWGAREVQEYLRGDAVPDENFQRDDLDDLEEAKGVLRRWEEARRVELLYVASWPVDRVVAHAKSVGRPVLGVFCDYVQKIRPPLDASFERRDLAVTAVTRSLKELAVALGAPVVVAAQMNRDALPKGFRDAVRRASSDGWSSTSDLQGALRRARPSLENLREGGVEQEVDLALGLLNLRADFEEGFESREGAYQAPRLPPPITPLDVGTLKARGGEVGRWATLSFDGPRGLVRDRQNGDPT